MDDSSDLKVCIDPTAKPSKLESGGAVRLILSAAALLLVCLCAVLGFLQSSRTEALLERTPVCVEPLPQQTECPTAPRDEAALTDPPLPAENAIAPPSESTQADSGTPPDRLETVYVTASGKRFHRADCTYLHGAGVAISRAEAIEKDCSPCKRCSP